MNCKRATPDEEGKVFAEVYVCPVCYEVSKAFYEKMVAELHHLLTIAKESIRVALIEGKFHLSEARVQDISKRELLEEIVKMEQARGTKR